MRKQKNTSNSKCDKTQIVTKLKNSNFDKKKSKHILWQTIIQIVSRTQIVIKPSVMKFKISIGDKTQKLKLWQISKKKIMTKLKKTKIVRKNSNCDKTQIVNKTQNLKKIF